MEGISYIALGFSEKVFRDHLDGFFGMDRFFDIPENPYFGTLDARCLYGMITRYRPARYYEIGSGFSTSVARQAVDNNLIPTNVFSIDPQPRADVANLCSLHYREKLSPELADQIVSECHPYDILFIDSSHRADESDVVLQWTRIIPMLRRGVIIHLHDIYLPEPYPEKWADRLYSEQYMLATALLVAPQKFKVLLANGYMSGKQSISGEEYGVGKSFWFMIA